MLVRPYERSTTKINSKNNLSPLRYFTEHLVGVFEKLPRGNDLDHKSSRLLIRWLKCTPRRVPAKIHTKIHKEIARRNKGPNGQNGRNEEARRTNEEAGDRIYWPVVPISGTPEASGADSECKRKTMKPGRIQQRLTSHWHKD
jgi:hypothetical protein